MLFISLILLIVILAVWYKQFENSFYKKAPNYPEPSKITTKKPVYIGFGDSLTRGNMSASWFDRVEAHLPGFQCFNAGVNADLTHTLLTRLDDIIECQPDIITILVGTNDVNATVSNDRLERYIKLNKITQSTDFEQFKQNYKVIIERLLAETNTRIILISLPPITEDWAYWVNKRADEYSAEIKAIAEKYQLEYVPFRETLRGKMPINNGQILDLDKGVKVIQWAVIQKYFFKKTWNELSQMRHAKYLTDNIHLNDEAAQILAEMVLDKINGIIKEFEG